MVEKSITGGICHAINRYAKAKNMIKKKESLYLKYWDVKHLYG